MFKKIFVTTMFVAVSSICLGAAPNNQKLNNDNAVVVVKNEIASYRNLTKLQQAQMLVSHKSVEDETKIRREAYLDGKTKNAKVVCIDNKVKSINGVLLNNSSDFSREIVSTSKSVSGPIAEYVKIPELSFKERLKAKFGLDLTKPKANQYLKRRTNNSLESVLNQKTESKSISITKPVTQNIDNKTADNAKVKVLQKQLQEARAHEAQLQKENNALKTELKKSISVMQKLKQENQ